MAGRLPKGVKTKAELIERYLSTAPATRPSVVVQRIKDEHGIDIVPSQVYAIRDRLDGKKRRRAKRAVARTTPESVIVARVDHNPGNGDLTVSVSDPIAVETTVLPLLRDFLASVKSIGGPSSARRLLDMIYPQV